MVIRAVAARLVDLSPMVGQDWYGQREQGDDLASFVRASDIG
jgi:hypothetical protein